MRRRFLLTILAALVLAPASHAASLSRFASADTEWVSLERGTGSAVLQARKGAVFGRIARGRVVITNLPRRGRRPSFSGCDRRQRLDRRTVLCAGRGLHFSIRGDWRVAGRGVGVDMSAVIRGTLTVKGSEGTYSIGGGSKHRWPRRARTFRIGG
ncbi:MAG: hypothetical protein M3312_06615 [Actinomycetota bacterium]|nr:hypothetical protein [Actinomycetota bacterium]